MTNYQNLEYYNGFRTTNQHLKLRHLFIRTNVLYNKNLNILRQSYLYAIRTSG